MRDIEPDAIANLQNTLSKGKIKPSWKKYDCQLVTPMYGGGVEAGQIDDQMPIRTSSIRGQLRFWWREAFKLNKSSQDLFTEELALWGGIGKSAAKKSCIRLRVEVKSENIEPHPINKFKQKSIKYIFGCAGISRTTQLWPKGLEFSLFFRCLPEDTEHKNKLKQFERSLQLWSSFGGIGGRTRRGFGAISVKQNGNVITPISISEIEQMKGKLVVSRRCFSSPEDAWVYTADKLYEFRQKPGVARKKLPNWKPGRSFWPEADQIRRFTSQHSSRYTPEHAAGNVFPRAAFGLPIAYKFKNNQDPQELTLVPKEKERMASPLILRPYWNGKNWYAAALLLPNWQDALDTPLSLKEDKKSKNKNIEKMQPELWPKAPAERKRVSQSIPPMKNKGSAVDPLSAFLEYFKG